MAIEQKQIDYAKELDDVLVLLVDLLKEIKAGKSVAQIATDELQDLFTAVAGVSDIPSEFATSREVALQTAFYRTASIVDTLLG